MGFDSHALSSPPLPRGEEHSNVGTGNGPYKHPVFWFHDGSIVVRVTDQLFRIHQTLISRHSRLFAALAGGEAAAQGLQSGNSPILEVIMDHDVIMVNLSPPISASDMEVLLEHLYHDVLLSPETPFPRVAAVLRITSPKQLDFPLLHMLARKYLELLFPGGPVPFFHPEHLEEALALATEYQINSIQKPLFYSLVTTTNFDTGDSSVSSVHPVAPPPQTSIPSVPSGAELEGRGLFGTQSEETYIGPPRASPPTLPRDDATRCTNLMTQLIDHFTPILFTPAATPHMACTDVFADTWMSLVIQPALADDGVYKPLETLERMKGIDWGKEGLCSSCATEKRNEWTEEQVTVWRLMDTWLGLGSSPNEL